MMILKDIISKLDGKDTPVVKKLQEGENFHVLAIGLRQGEILKEHKSDIPAKLVVIKGEVVYKAETGNVPLKIYEEHVIPVGEYHSVGALRNSLFLVIKG